MNTTINADAVKGGKRMTARKPLGTLAEYRGTFRLIVSYYDFDGKRRQKTKSTDLSIHGNKKRAQELLEEFTAQVADELEELYRKRTFRTDEREFTAYLKHWLEVKRDLGTLAENTYHNYHIAIYNRICPYFDKHYPHLDLRDVTVTKLEEYYHYRMKHDGVNANTIKHEHSYISGALKKAYRQDLIDRPVVDKVELPKRERFRGSFYSRAEMQKFLAAVEGDPLELPIKLAAYLGLRKSEALGIQWDAIDFEANTITIERTVVAYYDSELRTDVEMVKDKTKTESSTRTLTMPTPLVALLKKARSDQYANMMLHRADYNMKQRKFVCVDEYGNRVSSDRCSRCMTQFAKKAGVKKIRFHDLRHSCATLLLASGIPLKEIQAWLGHADYQTTADIYAHVAEDAMDRQAKALSDIFSFPA